MATNTALKAVALMGAIGLPAGAMAQSGQEMGFRVGTFSVQPTLSAQTGYTDNYLRNTTPEDSVFGVIAPSVAISSNWSRHALTIDLSQSHTFYSADAANNVHEYGAGAGFVLDVTRALSVNLGANYNLFGESAGSDNAAALVDGTTYLSNYGFNIGANYKAGLVRISPSASVGWTPYQDSDRVGGGTIDNSDRDRMSYGYGLEVGYEYLRGYEIFIAGQGQATNYDQDVDDNGFVQGSNAYRVLGGVNFRVTNLIEGRAGVGYAFRMNDEGRFDDSGAITADVGLTWSPTPILAFTLDASQAFNETTVAGASSSNDYSVKLGARYDWRRNIAFLPSIGFTRSEFEDADRTDDQIDLGLGVQYGLNEHLSLGAQYTYSREESDTGSWDENAVSLGIVGRY